MCRSRWTGPPWAWLGSLAGRPKPEAVRCCCYERIKERRGFPRRLGEEGSSSAEGCLPGAGFPQSLCPLLPAGRVIGILTPKGCLRPLGKRGPSHYVSGVETESGAFPDGPTCAVSSFLGVPHRSLQAAGPTCSPLPAHMLSVSLGSSGH